MQLTRFTDYTLRTLIAVGVGSERGVTIGEISAQYGISKNHLMKVAQQLGRAGYLATTRGKGGGLRLAVPAAQINLGKIVRETEGGFHVVPCFDADNPAPCVIAPACVLKRVLRESLGAFLAVLDGYTLEDLIAPKRRLKGLLSSALPAARPRAAVEAASG
jgi:Rrf2 family transcriptional regulator, nitric oxide-sensitive transcriptional repressor